MTTDTLCSTHLLPFFPFFGNRPLVCAATVSLPSFVASTSLKKSTSASLTSRYAECGWVCERGGLREGGTVRDWVLLNVSHLRSLFGIVHTQTHTHTHTHTYTHTHIPQPQDKLHQNICRRRTLVAIGTHDLDKIQGQLCCCRSHTKEGEGSQPSAHQHVHASTHSPHVLTPLCFCLFTPPPFFLKVLSSMMPEIHRRSSSSLSVRQS